MLVEQFWMQSSIYFVNCILLLIIQILLILESPGSGTLLWIIVITCLYPNILALFILIVAWKFTTPVQFLNIKQLIRKFIIPDLQQPQDIYPVIQICEMCYDTVRHGDPMVKLSCGHDYHAYCYTHDSIPCKLCMHSEDTDTVRDLK